MKRFRVDALGGRAVNNRPCVSRYRRAASASCAGALIARGDIIVYRGRQNSFNQKWGASLACRLRISECFEAALKFDQR